MLGSPIHKPRRPAKDGRYLHDAHGDSKTLPSLIGLQRYYFYTNYSLLLYPRNLLFMFF